MRPPRLVSFRSAAALVVAVLALTGLLAGPGSAAPRVGGSREALEFYAPQPGSKYKLGCAIYAELGEALCTSYTGRPSKATLDADGNVVFCRSSKGAEDACLLGNVGEARTLAVGRQVNVGPFRCSVLSTGVKCVVRATGEGFLFSARIERAVGGASEQRTDGT